MKNLDDIALSSWDITGHAVQKPAKPFKKLKISRIYYIKLEFSSFSLYKIGFTSRTVSHRVKTMGVPKGVKVKILQVVLCPNQYVAYNLEQALHLLYEKDRFYSKKPIIQSGYSELYKRDVLGLDRGLKSTVYRTLS